MKDLTKRERILMAIMSLWLFLNIVIYFMSSPIKNAKSIIYPFGLWYYGKDVHDFGGGYSTVRWYSINDVYDFTELLIYGG